MVLGSQGLRIPGVRPAVTLVDTSLASVRAGRPLTLTSAKNGTTTVLLSGGGVTKSVVVQIQQIPALLQAAATYTTAILAAAAGAGGPLQCQGWGAQGNMVAMEPTGSGAAAGGAAGAR